MMIYYNTTLDFINYLEKIYEELKKEVDNNE